MFRVVTMKSNKYPKSSNTHHDWLTVNIGYQVYPVVAEEVDIYGLVKMFLSDYFSISLDDLDIANLKNGIYIFDKAFSFYHGSVIVGYNSKQLMIQISGRGIEAFDEEYFGGLNRFISCLQSLTKNGIAWDCSRWDLARDLFNWSRRYSPETIYKERAKGNLVGRITAFKGPIKSGSVARPSALRGRKRELLLGCTTYLGRNPLQLRIYNKLAERYAKTKVDFNFKRWTRWEFQLNGKKSDYYFKKWLNEKDNSEHGLEEAWKKIASANFKFVDDHDEEIDQSRNRNKLEAAKWWNQVIDTPDNWDKAPAIVRNSTPSKKKKFYEHTVAPNAILRLNYLARGYLRNGVSVKDARKLALTAFLNELTSSLRDREEWVQKNKILFSGDAWNDMDSKLTVLNKETGEVIDFKDAIEDEED